MIILAKDFAQRADIENYVKNEFGDNIDSNRKDGHFIEGTAAELLNLSLSPSNRVYGVKVVLLPE